MAVTMVCAGCGEQAIVRCPECRASVCPRHRVCPRCEVGVMPVASIRFVRLPKRPRVCNVHELHQRKQPQMSCVDFVRHLAVRKRWHTQLRDPLEVLTFGVVAGGLIALVLNLFGW